MVSVQGQEVEFRFFRPQASSVRLVGDFTGWRGSGLQMLRTDEGYWVMRLTLTEGSYKFRYCADGTWFTDFAAFGVEYGPFGPDSIVRVEASREEAVEALAGRGTFQAA